MWPSSGLHPKVWWYCFTGLVWICHDGEISASVMFTDLWIGADGIVGNGRIAGKTRTPVQQNKTDLIQAQTASWDLRFIT